jgi:exopolysaccharide biosynthesis protein
VFGRIRIGICAGLAMVVLLAVPAQAAPSTSLTVRQRTFRGLQVNIASVTTGVRFALEPRQAKNSVTALAPVTADCGRRCSAGVNADFFNVTTREPIGGVIIDGNVLRSPNTMQNQVVIGPAGQISAGVMAWAGVLSAPTGMSIPLAVNDPAAATPILYDGYFGAPTPKRQAVEFAFAERLTVGLRMNRVLEFRFMGSHQPGRPVPNGQVVVSATGPDGAQLVALRNTFRTSHIRRTIAIRFATDPVARDSLGANHVLLRAGHIVPIAENDRFVNGALPRTLLGWNRRGRVTLVTIGSPVPGRTAGVSLPVAARFLKSLGVTNAVNLDGGGSSTFVRAGQVLNKPSDGRARAVTNAWVIVRR